MTPIKLPAAWALSVAFLLQGCASSPQFQARPDLLHDEWFGANTATTAIIAPEKVLALSGDTASALDRAALRTNGANQRVELLVDTIYGPQRREFNYLTAVTTPAEETYLRHSGNCLSLALMSMALADRLGLDAQLQEVPMVPIWERHGRFDLISGHVFVVVRGNRFPSARTIDMSGDLVIDFDPSVRRAYNGRILSAPISRERGLAMFYNNRGAEAYVAGKNDLAYANYRQASTLDPGFYGTWFNLSQLYLRAGKLQAAEATLHHALEISPKNYNGLQSMQSLLSRLGRGAEAATYAKRIDQFRDMDPYYHYMVGAEKFQLGDLRGAIGSLERANELGVGFAEIHEALRDAYRAIGDIDKVREEKKRLLEIARARETGAATR